MTRTYPATDDDTTPTPDGRAGPQARAGSGHQPSGLSALALGLTALTLSALAAGFALAVNIVHYRSWPNVSTADFGAFQSASARHTVPAAVALGLPSLVWAVRLARRGLAGVDRRQLIVATGLAAVPWITTPAYFVALQQRLHDAGPAMGPMTELVWADAALRVLPPLAQTLLLALALRRHLSEAPR